MRTKMASARFAPSSVMLGRQRDADCFQEVGTCFRKARNRHQGYLELSDVTFISELDIRK